MSALKFECPGCGQHMECDRACGGDIIHCPRCCAELRIPFGSSEIPGTVLRAELILHAPAAAPAPTAPTPSPTAAPATPAAPPPEVTCPICQSHLRVPSGPASGDGPRLAELIRKGSVPAEATPNRKQPDESHPDLAHMSLEERERQIAAAREAHPIQLNQPVKPRLDYILSDEASPVQKDEHRQPSGDGSFSE
jgi:hypothetical protein